MTRKVTIRDVAREAGVSVGTASRVINGSTNVAVELRQSVERAMIQIGFQPNAAAQSIRSGSSRTIGILISDITVERLALMARAAQAEFEAAGYAVFIACHENRKEREAELLQLLVRRRIDGLIHTACTDRTIAAEDLPPQPAMPTVVYDRDSPAGADAIRVAHRSGAFQATELLIRLGHRRIGMITGPEHMYPARTRIEGFREALQAHGLPFRPENLRAGSFANALLDTNALLDLAERPTAIILGGTNMLAGALEAIRSRGLDIPRDLSVVSAGDSDLTRLATPAITVVRWDFREMGRASARLLLERLQDPNQAVRQVLFEPELVLRGSCAAPPPG